MEIFIAAARGELYDGALAVCHTVIYRAHRRFSYDARKLRTVAGSSGRCDDGMHREKIHRTVDT
jgi:hypothetical protein